MRRSSDTTLIAMVGFLFVVYPVLWMADSLDWPDGVKVVLGLGGLLALLAIKLTGVVRDRRGAGRR